MWKRLWMVGGVSGLVLLWTGLSVAAEEKETVFEMQEVSVFETAQPDQPTLLGLSLGGQYVLCDSKRMEEVKKYPELKSDRPIYGSVTFDMNRANPKSGIRFLFVIDEVEKEPPAEAKPAKDQPPAETPAVTRAPPPVPGLANGNYGRLYFDANRDLDLTNDPVVTLMKDPPARLARSRQVVFDYLNVPFDHGPKLGTRPLKILTTMRVLNRTRAFVVFTAAVARQGKIEIGGQQYNALLTQASMITGRFDKAYTGLYLTPVDAPRKRIMSWWGEGYLGAIRQFDGTRYRISATPTGDKLTVGPYGGESGVFKLGPGHREDIEKLGISGALSSEEVILPLGDVSSLATAEKLPQHEVPVGEYAPLSLVADFGSLQVSLSQNYYAKEEPHARLDQPSVRTFKIRKDKPCVLEFADKPLVLFNSPLKDQTFKPGDTVRVGAAIVDPALDLLLRGVKDTTQKVSERTYTDREGNKVTVPTYAPLNPMVVITDSSGKQVSEGKIPFG